MRAAQAASTFEMPLGDSSHRGADRGGGGGAWAEAPELPSAEAEADEGLGELLPLELLLLLLLLPCCCLWDCMVFTWVLLLAISLAVKASRRASSSSLPSLPDLHMCMCGMRRVGRVVSVGLPCGALPWAPVSTLAIMNPQTGCAHAEMLECSAPGPWGTADHGPNTLNPPHPAHT